LWKSLFPCGNPYFLVEIPIPLWKSLFSYGNPHSVVEIPCGNPYSLVEIPIPMLKRELTIQGNAVAKYVIHLRSFFLLQIG